jgi:uncharacterized protein involved in outer membrane biogenesis
MARRNRALRIIGWIVLVLIVLVIAAGAALWFGGTPGLAWAIGHPVSGMLGRQISIDGPFKIRWGNPTEIVAEDVHLANASWGSAPDMFEAKRLVVDIYMRSLIFGPMRIPRIEIDGGKLLLEKSKNGDKNWSFGNPAPKKRHQFPDLRRFLVRNSELTYRNGVTGAVSELGIADLDVSEPNPQQPLTIAAQGSFQKAPVRLAGTAGPIAELRDTSKPYPVKLEGAVGEARLVAEGGIAEPLDFDGLDLRLSLSVPHLQQIADVLGVPLPELANLHGTAELTGGDGKFALKALSAKTGASDLEGGIEVDANAKVPMLEANLTSSYVDLADFKGLFGGRPQSAAAPARPAPAATNGRVLPDTSIAVHKLPGLNAKVSFYATRIKSTGGLPLERVALGFELKNGELIMNPLRFHTAHGDVALRFNFTPFTQDSPPKMHAEVDVRHIDLHELLDHPTMPAIVRQTAGIIGGFVKIDTTGTSTREFLGHMDGDAGLFMQNGQVSELLDRLAPIDVLGALGVYAFGGKPVPINCFVSRFDIKSGIATATTFLFDTSGTIVTGEGNLNFADETITLKLVPRNKSFTVVSLRTPVDVGGTFAKPAFHLETGNLIARLGAAVGLGILAPPAALLPLIDTGLGDQNACHQAYSAQNPPGNPVPKSGSSLPSAERPTPTAR